MLFARRPIQIFVCVLPYHPLACIFFFREWRLKPLIPLIITKQIEQN